MSRKRLPLLLIVLPCFGYTDCDYYNTVVVPDTDTSDPVLATRMWLDGVEVLRFGYASEEAETIFVVPAIYDAGGARTLEFNQTAIVYCHNSSVQPELGQLVYIDYQPKTTSQSGGPGSVVSNGMYLFGDVTDLSNTGNCAAGFDLVDVTYNWTITGTDMAGNDAEPFHGSIVYTP